MIPFFMHQGANWQFGHLMVSDRHCPSVPATLVETEVCCQPIKQIRNVQSEREWSGPFQIFNLRQALKHFN